MVLKVPGPIGLGISVLFSNDSQMLRKLSPWKGNSRRDLVCNSAYYVVFVSM